MSRHRSPDPLRYWNAVATAAAALTVAALLGIADNIGDDFTPAAHTTPTFSRPVDDDPGQLGRRGLPVPARIFPTDLNAPTYMPEPLPEVPVIAPSAPPRACRCSPRVPGPPQTVTGLSAGPLAEVTTAPTPTEIVTEAAQTTAAPTTEPTATEPVDQPEETPVPDEPTETVPTVTEPTMPPVEVPALPEEEEIP